MQVLRGRRRGLQGKEDHSELTSPSDKAKPFRSSVLRERDLVSSAFLLIFIFLLF